jgi:hypothetical protein
MSPASAYDQRWPLRPGGQPQRGQAERLVQRQVVRLGHEEGCGCRHGDGDAGGEGDARRAADLAGEQPGHRSRERADDRERDRRGPGRRPRSHIVGSWMIAASGIQWALLGIGSIGLAGMRPPTSTNDQMKSMLKPCSGVQRPGHVDVVVRVGVGGVRVQPEHDAPNDQGERIESEGDPHGEAA